MANGSDVGFQGCVPLEGDSNIVQRTAATDILTITGAASQTGDFLVCETSAGTEKFYVTSAGAGYFAGAVTIKNTQASLAALSTVSGIDSNFSNSAAFVLCIQMINAIQARMVELGFLT